MWCLGGPSWIPARCGGVARSGALVPLGVLLAVLGCGGDTCQEKLGQFTCAEENYTLSCADRRQAEDPVCVCAGEFALADDDTCRRIDVEACCGCATAVPNCLGGGVDAEACAAALRRGDTLRMRRSCLDACEDPCWFLAPEQLAP